MTQRPRVLLLQLPLPPPGPQPIRGNVPLAAGYLKLFARRRGLDDSFQIDILPTALANALGDQGLVEEILQREPRLVGFTCYLWNVERTLWVADRLKRADRGIRVLLGGPEITADNRWVLDRPEVDYAVFGEGEAVFADLLAALRSGPEPAAAIGGLARPGQPLPPPRSPLGSLDAVSSPYLEGILDAAQEQFMLLETVRGCRHRCRYCYYPKSYNAIYALSAEQVSACLAHAAEQGVREVFLLDPTLNQRPGFLDFLRLLARGNPHWQLSYSAELRAEGIGPRAARALGEANFRTVEVGLQSIDPETQRLMGRRIHLPRFERGVRALASEGISVRVDLILGLPGDTADSVRRGIEYLQRLRPFCDAQIFNLSILPGTAFRRQAKLLGIEYQPRPPYYVLRTPTLEVDEMYRLMAEAEGALGTEFDAPGPPQWQPAAGPAIDRAVVELDGPRADEALPPAPLRAQAFTLWLRSADFSARWAEAAACITQVLADNPHTTLQVVLEPLGDPRNVTPATLESLLAACHRTTSYLDWHSSLHPAGLLGAKRLVVVAPWSERGRGAMSWIDEVGQYAALAWQGGDASDASLGGHEWVVS